MCANAHLKKEHFTPSVGGAVGNEFDWRSTHCMFSVLVYLLSCKLKWYFGFFSGKLFLSRIDCLTCLLCLICLDEIVNSNIYDQMKSIFCHIFSLFPSFLPFCLSAFTIGLQTKVSFYISLSFNSSPNLQLREILEGIRKRKF